MYDSYNREISYLRISVTDRCNLRCSYCMPEEGTVSRLNHRMMSFEEITEVVRILAPAGISKIRLTGGEPLVRKGIAELVGMLSGIEGIREVTLTTNGQRLAELAPALAEKGLGRVNISLDTLNPVRYRELTRGGEIRRVLQGIDAAKSAGLEPVKVNCVITPETSEREISDLGMYCREKSLELRLIRQMNLVTGLFWKVEGGQGGHCRICNRIRLTADGRFIPCLFSDQEFSIRKYGIKEAFRKAVHSKPAKGIINSKHSFYNLGG